MLALAHTLGLAAVLAGPPAPRIHLRAPAEDASASEPSAAPATPTGPAGPNRPNGQDPPELARTPIDYGHDGIPRPSAGLGDYSPPLPARKLGTNTTIFVNFDGVEIDYCNPSNAHANCSWLEVGRTFPPFSGSLSQRVAILDAMRSQLAGFGVRVTAQRPPADEPYAMVVYGGEREEDEPLGRAPAGDCLDDLPNQIAFVYLDGDNERDWVNGGAATALHESAHTWGFDHIGLEGYLMAPAGDNSKANYFDGCAQIVEDVALTPVEAGTCPGLSLELCGLSDFQHDIALLHLLFGAPYIDDTAPELILISPDDGAYFQVPANFDVELRVIDDLHPQVYELAIAIDGLVDNAFAPVLDPSFVVEALPEGEWTFRLRLRDAAGNEDSLAFTVVVGEDPPPVVQDEDGCACHSAGPGDDGPGSPGGLLGLLLPGLALLLRPRSRP